jgi:hypothetical protein
VNTSFEISKDTSVEWFTPPEIIHALGKFDLDPCSSHIAWRFNQSAQKFYTASDDGLSKEWFGRVWLNPPYTQPIITHFMQRMALHNNGVALIYNRSDNRMFQNVIFPVCDSIMFLKGRVCFFHIVNRGEGINKGGSPGAGSVLVAFGRDNTKALENSGLDGCIFKPAYGGAWSRP